VQRPNMVELLPHRNATTFSIEAHICG